MAKAVVAFVLGSWMCVCVMPVHGGETLGPAGSQAGKAIYDASRQELVLSANDIDTLYVTASPAVFRSDVVVPHIGGALETVNRSRVGYVALAPFTFGDVVIGSTGVVPFESLQLEFNRELTGATRVGCNQIPDLFLCVPEPPKACALWLCSLLLLRLSRRA